MRQPYRPNAWKAITDKIDIAKYMPLPQTEFPIVIPSSLEFDLMKVHIGMVYADAMLEALRKEGRHTEPKCPTLSINVPYEAGTLVFIPDDKE